MSAPAKNGEVVDECPYELTGQRTVFNGKWLVTKEVDFRNHRSGESGVWQSAHRPKTTEKADVQGVDIIAILKKDGKKYFILVKQFRIPVNAWCLEFPAGLIDPNETVEDAAIRELKEETGYSKAEVTGRTAGIQPLDPGMTDDSCNFVMLEVDGDCAENANPKQVLDSAEAIEVVLVECDKLFQFVRANERKLQVEAMLYSFAIGYAMNHHTNPLNGNGMLKNE